MSRCTIGRYLIQRLETLGLRHIFGIPGDYVLGFYDLIVASRMKHVGTCTEIGAGYAADAYARVNGLGCVCVTYCVGGLNALNAVAGAYAEKSPLIVVSGAPGLGERARSPLLHHQVRDHQTQLEIYQKVTVAAAALHNAIDAPRLIDQTLAAAIQHKRPVYLELPRDRVDEPCAAPGPWKIPADKSDRLVLREAVAEAAAMLRAARRPAILGGVEIHRYGLQRSLLKLVERTGLPVAATILGKSILSELHPQYVGVYEGAMGREETRRSVEEADALLILGALMTDINLGIFTARLDPDRTIDARSDRITIGRHHYDGVVLRDFIEALARLDLRPRPRSPRRQPRKTPPPPFKPRPRAAITVKRFFQRIDSFLEPDDVVICDVGDSLFGALDLTIHRKTEFLSPAYYTSMGFAVPAALGAQVGKKRRRPLVFVGDGAFQMTCQELSTIVRQRLDPILFVLNNQGYTTERFIHEGPYNDINNWSYHLWPQIVGEGWGCEVRTEGELEHALTRARQNTHCFSIINLHLDKMDSSDALIRLGRRLGRRVSN
jgi:indolepyruvate decarboxylase